MKIYDKQAEWRLQYRKNQIERKIEAIRDVLSGYHNSPYTRIEDENGRVDAGKLDEMIEGMTDSLCRYLENEGKKLPGKKQLEFYKSFLYCAILSPVIEFDALCPFYGYYISKNYGSLLFLAECEMDHESLKDLISYEQKTWTEPDDEQCGLLYTARVAYEELSGKNLKDSYSPKEKKILKELEKEWNEGEAVYERGPGITNAEEADENTDSYEEPEPLYPEDEYEVYEETPEEKYENYLREQEREQEEFEEYLREANELFEKWKAHIPDAERFMKEYLSFRSMYLSKSVDRSRLKEDIKNMVDVYLYEQEITVYALDNNFSLVDRLMDGMANRVSREILRARILSDDQD